MLSYLLERASRRSVGLLVDPQGLRVRAPLGVPLDELEVWLQRKKTWILGKLEAVAGQTKNWMEQGPRWVHGARVPYMGAHLRLDLSSQHAFAGARVVLAPVLSDAEGSLGHLRLALPPGAPEGTVRRWVLTWLKAEAGRVLAPRLAHFSARMGVQPRRWALSGALTRWGSASADGSLRLNWRLVQVLPDLLDYVVVHELAHLRHMNHSPAFWAQVARVLPDHAERRRRLRSVMLDKEGVV